MKKFLLYILSVMVILGVIGNYAMFISAEDNNLYSSCEMYSLDDKSKYDFEGHSYSESNNAIGRLELNGNITQNKEQQNSFTSYTVSGSNVSLSYQYDPSSISTVETEWHIKNDNGKTVGDIQLDDKINSGTIIVQTSFDGINWVTDTKYTDVFSGNSLDQPVYTTKDIQLQNGCYYRVIVAYQLEKRLDDSNLWITPIQVKNYDTKKIVEVYSFYIIDKEASRSTLKATDEPRMELGKKVKAKIGNCYEGEEPITVKDPHYGWDIGTFTVNGYTQATTADNGDTVFLKKLGDKVTLWFTLSQNIDRLNGDDKCVISEDKDGSDQNMEIPKTNFGRGTLIIRYTDYQNKTHEPIIYTNYLEANTRTGADTKVQLFEEGNYEVTLDYEIKCGGKYSNYKIPFRFQIRNGNCMVFPMDSETGKELSDFSITPNGFYLDMARSRYLKINVAYSTIKESAGLLVLDQRSDTPAKETDKYTNDGIYKFTVKNQFTDSVMTKTIYVGDSKLYRLLIKNNNSVDEINQKLSEGYTIGKFGDLIAPVIETEPIVTELPVTETAETDSMATETVTEATSISVTEIITSQDTETQITDDTDNEEAVEAMAVVDVDSRKSLTPVIVIGAIILAAVGFVVIKIKK